MSENPMNTHERHAWRLLVERGAREIELGGKPGLDLTTARPGRTKEQRSDYIGALLAVSGRSGAVRRHVDRRGNPTFVVTDRMGR
jgi:hypothetical protein